MDGWIFCLFLTMNVYVILCIKSSRICQYIFKKSLIICLNSHSICIHFLMFLSAKFGKKNRILVKTFWSLLTAVWPSPGGQKVFLFALDVEIEDSRF